jgi:hypothetical protein
MEQQTLQENSWELNFDEIFQLEAQINETLNDDIFKQFTDKRTLSINDPIDAANIGEDVTHKNVDAHIEILMQSEDLLSDTSIYYFEQETNAKNETESNLKQHHALKSSEKEEQPLLKTIRSFQDILAISCSAEVSDVDNCDGFDLDQVGLENLDLYQNLLSTFRGTKRQRDEDCMAIGFEDVGRTNDDFYQSVLSTFRENQSFKRLRCEPQFTM